MKTTETGLVKQGSAKFGKALLQEGAEANRKALQTSVVGHVSEILMRIQQQEDYIAQSELNLKLLRDTTAAIEAGEFTLSNYGVIIFNDEKLQKGVVAMLECANCGYSLRGKQTRFNGAITEQY